MRNITGQDASVPNPQLGEVIGVASVPVEMWPLPAARTASAFVKSYKLSNADPDAGLSGGSIELGLGYAHVTRSIDPVLQSARKPVSPMNAFVRLAPFLGDEGVAWR